MSSSTSPLVDLDDYLTGHMSDDEASSFEETLFETPDDPSVRFFDRAQTLIEWLAVRGGFSGGGTAKDVEMLRAQGYRVRVLDFRPGQGTEPGVETPVTLEMWGDDVDVVVFRTLVDVRDFDDVECAVESADGTLIKTFRGIQCDPTTGNLYAICAPPLAKMAYGHARRISRISGIRDGKRETIVVFDSTPG